MSEWRQQILRRLVPRVARITAVSDPDGMLRDPLVFQAIQAEGFSVVQFEDSVSFRFDYESRFRARWDAGEENLELVVVFTPSEHEFETLPADVLDRAQRISFSLKELFPRLSYDVVSHLETIYFDPLYRAQQQHASQPHDSTQTRGFILRHVFGIEPTVIKSIPDLLRMLLQRHYGKMSLPPTLDIYLVDALHSNPNFSGWPLEIIVSNAAAFWEFLNERWPIFVRQSRAGTITVEERAQSLKYSGPELLPFGHDDVRVYVDNLFEDGLLTPIEWEWNQALEQTWIRVGLLGNTVENTDLRFEELGRHLLETCPDSAATPQEWLTYAYRYAQGNVLWTDISAPVRSRYQNQFPELRSYVNQQFGQWLSSQYAGLYNYPAISPLMVHHIPGFIAHQLAKEPSQRIAFVLVDGLAIEQWLVLRDSLKANGCDTGFEESALFAWIPTVTPISRQSAFAGRIPRYFAETILRTDRDEVRWRQFWVDRHLAAQEIGFVSVEGNPSDLGAIEDSVTDQTRVLAITLRKVDKIMHGMQLGSDGMVNQMRTWVEQGLPRALLDFLKARHFSTYISSDHGNAEATGVGRPGEGVLADKGGERCRIYPDKALRTICLAEIIEAQSWDHAGLPDKISPILASYGKAFVQAGTTPVICHGGAALEEVCVPFIRIPGDHGVND